MIFGMLCSEPLRSSQIRTNPTSYQEILLISLVRYVDIKTKMNAAAVSLVW